jgi:hypothetical protein
MFKNLKAAYRIKCRLPKREAQNVATDVRGKLAIDVQVD